MLRVRLLINTPLQRGDSALAGTLNRFSGFELATEPCVAIKTAEAVNFSAVGLITPLKRGVNERRLCSIGELKALQR